MSLKPYTTEIGDLLVIAITGTLDTYIAEVTQAVPLQMKVMETGPYSSLRDGDFIIREDKSAQLQRDDREGTTTFLTEMQQAGRRVLSGLRKLNVVKVGILEEILPG